MNFLLENILLVAIALISGGMLLYPILQKSSRSITTQEAIQRINHAKALILDVREAKDYASGHIRDARHIASADLQKKLGELDKFKARQIIVVCQNESSAARVVSQLKKAGFEQALSLNGGMTEWAAQNLPVVK